MEVLGSLWVLESLIIVQNYMLRTQLNETVYLNNFLRF